MLPGVVDEVEEGGFEQLHDDEGSGHRHQRHAGEHDRALVHGTQAHGRGCHVPQEIVERWLQRR